MGKILATVVGLAAWVAFESQGNINLGGRILPDEEHSLPGIPRQFEIVPLVGTLLEDKCTVEFICGEPTSAEASTPTETAETPVVAPTPRAATMTIWFANQA